MIVSARTATDQSSAWNTNPAWYSSSPQPAIPCLGRSVYASGSSGSSREPRFSAAFLPPFTLLHLTLHKVDRRGRGLILTGRGGRSLSFGMGPGSPAYSPGGLSPIVESSLALSLLVCGLSCLGFRPGTEYSYRTSIGFFHLTWDTETRFGARLILTGRGARLSLPFGTRRGSPPNSPGYTS